MLASVEAARSPGAWVRTLNELSVSRNDSRDGSAIDHPLAAQHRQDLIRYHPLLFERAIQQAPAQASSRRRIEQAGTGGALLRRLHQVRECAGVPAPARAPHAHGLAPLLGTGAIPARAERIGQPRPAAEIGHDSVWLHQETLCGRSGHLRPWSLDTHTRLTNRIVARDERVAELIRSSLRSSPLAVRAARERVQPATVVLAISGGEGLRRRAG